MNKTAIKNFAVTARRKLIADITQKAYQLGITQEEIKQPELFEEGFRINQQLFKEYEMEQRQKLIDEITNKNFDQVIEEVAYTWFNRFIAIRFMEVNDYLPIGIRVFSSLIDGKKEPDVVTEVDLIVDELNLDQTIVHRLQDASDTADLFKYILIRQCNKLGDIMPGMFEKIHDYTELLLPDQLLVDGSVVRDMVTIIDEADWTQQVEIIGWLYQYYISEKKDEVFAGLKKNQKITKENIPAATQLFTPKWIVQYMVENSIGRLWLESHPDEELQQQWAYYLEEAVQDPTVQAELDMLKNPNLKPEDITVLDPCMGSGHILVYAFDVLHEIYEFAGYAKRDIPGLILKNNLYGLDIDDRASQLSYFSLLMKACSYNTRILQENLTMNVCSIQQSNNINKEEIQNVIEQSAFEGDKELLQQDVEYIVDVFHDAKEYGSILDVDVVNFEQLDEWIIYLRDEAFDDLFLDQFKENLLGELPALLQQAKIMSGKYGVVATNPPYMGSGMNDTLNDFVRKEYPDSKTDLYAIFMEVSMKFTFQKGFISMINQHSWMFLSSFEKVREKMIEKGSFISMLHLGPRAFEEVSGEVVQSTAFILRNVKIMNLKGSYIRLIEERTAQEKEKKALEAIQNRSLTYHYLYNQENFKKIPGSIFTYWSTDKTTKIFEDNKKLFEASRPRHGMSTGKNDVMLRYWYEIQKDDISYDSESIFEFESSGKKYVPYNKGGTFRKWYGNQDYVIRYDKFGRDLMSSFIGHRHDNKQYFFKEGITWSRISSSSFGVRYSPAGFIFDANGSMVFPEVKYLYYYLSLMCSSLANYFIRMINPTMAIQAGSVSMIPIVEVDDLRLAEIDEITRKLVNDSKYEWDCFEDSWNFSRHPFIGDDLSVGEVEMIFKQWDLILEGQYERIRQNQEELNRIFIDIYNLQDELTPEVKDADVTVRKADVTRDVKSFISYAVGCMFGRYSLDREGLVFAGGEFDHSQYSTFAVDVDNVIPITDDQYFEDDIVGRFFDFLRITFSEETFEKNLDFIAEALTKRSTETSRQRIRRYFLNEFYKDHVKMYQKCPIYWQFDSGKNDGFKALVYMHRYEPGLAARVRTDYLHLLQRKYEAEMIRLDMTLEEDISVADKAGTKKRKEKLQKQLLECQQYDQVIAHVAYQKIAIDLDDGVKVNYAKFQQVDVPQDEGRKSVVQDVFKGI